MRQMRVLAQGAALHKYTAWPHACAAVAAFAEVRKPLDNRAPTRLIWTAEQSTWDRSTTTQIRLVCTAMVTRHGPLGRVLQSEIVTYPGRPLGDGDGPSGQAATRSYGVGPCGWRERCQFGVAAGRLPSGPVRVSSRPMRWPPLEGLAATGLLAGLAVGPRRRQGSARARQPLAGRHRGELPPGSQAGMAIPAAPGAGL
jgi:hypothetical protein